MCLIDLAGSERASSTGVSGDRLVEANNINKSLSTLGDVIQALSKAGSSNQLLNSAAKSITHVPYRNSVLTWLLKDSIGGNSKSVMLATVSPTDLSYSESLSTLRYVERAKLISNHAVINETANDAQIIAQLQKQVTQLQKQLVEKEHSVVVKTPGGIAHDNNEQVRLQDLLTQKQRIIDEYEKGMNIGNGSNQVNSSSHPIDSVDRMKVLVLAYKKEKELLQGQYESLLQRYRYGIC